MSKRAIVVLMLCLLFVFRTSTSEVRAAAPSSETWLKLLQTDQCRLPCWVGIEPGKTTLFEAFKLLEAAYGNNSIYSFRTTKYWFAAADYKPTGYELRIWFSSDVASADLAPTSIVHGISMQAFYDTGETVIFPTVSDLLSAFGQPSILRLGTGVDVETIWLMFRDPRVTFGVADYSQCEKVRLDQPVIYINLYDQYPRLGDWHSKPAQWQGFGHCYNLPRVLSEY